MHRMGGGSKRPENVLTYYMDGFLVHNGFVFESNEDDCLTLKLGISKNDALIHEKVNILEELSIARNGLFFIGCNLDEKPLDPALLAFLRVLCFTKKEIDDFQGNHEKICSLSEPNTADGKFIFDTFIVVALWWTILHKREMGKKRICTLFLFYKPS